MLRVDTKKRNLIQNQLMLMLHAEQCSDEASEFYDCQVPQCSPMKRILAHMKSCTVENCNVEYCNSSRRISDHWRVCKDFNCFVCKKVRRKTAFSVVGPMLASEVTPSDLPSTSALQSTSQMPWHACVNERSRRHLIERIAKDLNNTCDGADAANVFHSCAINIEQEMFSKAASLEQYYALIAEKVYSIRKSAYGGSSRVYSSAAANDAAGKPTASDEPSSSAALCAICFEEVLQSLQGCRLLKCNHAFHAKCINRWLREKLTCPICRAMP